MTRVRKRTLRSDIVFLFALAFACALAWVVRDVLLLLYVSGLFAVVLTPVVRWTAELKVGRFQPFKKTAVLGLMLVLLALITAFGFTALPPVIRDLEQFTKEAPTRLPQILAKLQRIPFVDRLNPADLSTKIEDLASHAATQLVLSIRDWAGGLFRIAMGVILTVYFIAEGEQAYKWFLSFFPTEGRERLDKALRRAEIRMGKWLLGQGSLMLILGVASTIVFASLHVRYAYALGVLTGMLNLIPVLGAAISISLALLVAAIDSWTAVICILVFYVIYLQVENSYLVPRIMRSSVDLPGLAILVALLLGAALEGIVGAMVSVPTAVLVAVLVDEYLVQREAVEQSGEPVETQKA
ncbi:MAG: AI-2E family transporter [Terracidiphilus sp.]|jgi:predicted PurR-regulated permease PerM